VAAEAIHGHRCGMAIVMAVLGAKLAVNTFVSGVMPSLNMAGLEAFWEILFIKQSYFYFS
jgi:hypothetical protein